MKRPAFVDRAVATAKDPIARQRAATVVLAVMLAIAMCSLAWAGLAWMKQRYAPAVEPLPVPAAAIPSPDAPVPTGSSAATEPADTPPAAAGKRFFTSDEVDTLAAPRPDWQVDPNQLLSLGVRRLSFEVMIDVAFAPVRCRILSMEPADPKHSGVLADRLCTTRLSPALRGGIAVPSVRVIEMMLTE